MMGSMFAGCDESPGTFELYQGRKYKVYRGMGPIRYGERQQRTVTSRKNAKKLVPEGVEGRVAYKGHVEGYCIPADRRSTIRMELLREQRILRSLRQQADSSRFPLHPLKESSIHMISISQKRLQTIV